MRTSGILVHVSCLPSPYGIGDLGPGAMDFVEFLASAQQGIWQVLPLSPTSQRSFNDPYHSISAFAGNPLLISPELLRDAGLLTAEEIAHPPAFPKERVDFAAVSDHKAELLRRACQRFVPEKEPGFALYCAREASWLEDFALFTALSERFAHKPWTEWPPPFRDRNPETLEETRSAEVETLHRVRVEQYLFHLQWAALRHACAERGIRIFGDMPIYVDHNSVDCWTQPELWQLNERGQPTVVAGVPPDYFSATGQLWLSPLYDWPQHQNQRFAWWLARIGRNLTLFDCLRIDHFRGLVAYWEVLAGEKTAENGRWVQAPVRDFLSHVRRRFPTASLIAEDLGVITPEVREVMRDFGLPGMRVLQFGLTDSMADNPHAPHNWSPECWAYTGTHDNNPCLGWFDEDASQADRERLGSYLGRTLARHEVATEMIRLVMASVAEQAVVPMQDLLELGSEGRMNRPGNLEGNWDWRMVPDRETTTLAERLASLTRLYGRA